MSMSTPLLPHDLVVMIIDFVKATRSLENCALVCRSWVHPSQSNLFYSVTIAISEHLGILSPYRFRVLLDHSPYIAQYVRELEVLFYSDGRPQQQQTLATILPRFHRLSTLTLDGRPIAVDASVGKAVGEALSSLHIQHVRLVGWAFDNVADVGKLLGTSLRSLSSLEFQNISISNPIAYQVPSLPVPAPAGDPVILQSIKLDYHGNSLPVWFKSLSHPIAAKKLVLQFGGGDDDMRKFMVMFAPRLEELDLEFAKSQPHIDFSLMPRLTKLSLHYTSRTLDILKTFKPHNYLAFLRADFRTGFPEDAEALDELLTSAHFPHLQTVELSLYPNEREPLLPRLRARDILQVEHRG